MNLEETAEPEAEAVAPPQEAETDLAVVERAQKYGWKSPDDWKGDPPEGGHLSPEEYLDRPHVQVRIQNDEIASLKRDLSEIKEASTQQVANMRKMAEDAAERRREAHQAEVDRIGREMRGAASEADTERYDELEKERNAAVEARDAVQAPPASETPVAQEWKAKNAWYGKDLYASMEAERISAAMTERGATPEQQIEAVDRHMKRNFPELFASDEKPQRQTKVDGGGLAAITGAKSDFDKLGSEEQAQAKADVAEGLYKDVDEWTKVYLS